MKSISNNHIALFIPLSFLAHQVEEYLGSFPAWYSDLLNADLSNQDFLIINGIGLALITFFSVSYIFNRNKTILVALGTVVLMNGITHTILSIVTLNYSPGTISSILLFLPLGTLIYRRLLPDLSEGQKAAAISIGILFLISVSLIASSM